MASDKSMWPRSWGIKPPLNTQPTSPSAGAYYKVLFRETEGNPRIVTADSNSTAMAYFVVPWIDRERFEIDTLGTSTYTAGQNRLNRFLPLYHGDPAQQSFSLRQLTAISFHNINKKYHEALGLGDGPYSLGWPKTEMQAYRGDFIQHDFPLLKDTDVTSATTPELKRYVTKYSETESYHRKIPGYGFAFDGHPEQYCTVLASLPEFVTRWIYTTHRWPYPDSIPQDYIDRTLGTVNDATFDTDQIFTLDNGTTQTGFVAEQLKYENCVKSKSYYGADDKLYIDIQHIFLANYRNWNKQISPDGTYQYVYQLGPGNAFLSPLRTAYQKRGFDKLFKPRGAT